MISREHRFHGHASLRHVYRLGKTVRGPWFAVRTLPNPKREHYRAAVVVSKKVNKSAVVRNRIRRRLYEALRLEEQSIISPHDIVISVFSAAISDVEFTQLARQLKKQLRDAGVLARRISRPQG